MGSNPGTIYWMDMTFFTLMCCINCNDFCLKIPKINEAGVGSFLKEVLQHSAEHFAFYIFANERKGLFHLQLLRGSIPRRKCQIIRYHFFA